MTFDVPVGLEIPQGKQAGDKFEALAEFKIGKDGKLTLCAVDGVELKDYKDGDEPTSKSTVMDKIREQMQPVPESQGEGY